jgi:hypothetical protein
MNTRVSNNYKEMDTDVGSKSLIKLTIEVEEMKPQAQDH